MEGLGRRFVYGSSFSAAGTKSHRILCYGDSNSVGFRGAGQTLLPYGQDLAEALRVAGFPCEVTSCGLCGFTSEELVNEIRAPYIQDKTGNSGVGLAHLLQEGEFDLVIIMAGTNDLARVKDPRLTQAFVARLHSTCHALGIPTVNIVPPTVSKNIRGIREARKRLADCMNTWATACPHVLLSLDSETMVPKNISQLWEPDDIHFSTAGSKQLAEKLAWQLAKVFGQLGHKSSPLGNPQNGQRQVQPPIQACSKHNSSVMTFPNPFQNLKRPALGMYATYGPSATATMNPYALAPVVPVAMCVY